MTYEEKELYLKAVRFIKNNMENPDFISVLKEEKIRVIPSSLSYVIEKLQNAGYTVTKPTVENATTCSLSQEEIKDFVKEKDIRVFSLIKNTEISCVENKIIISFPTSASYHYKQLVEDQNAMSKLNALATELSSFVEVNIKSN